MGCSIGSSGVFVWIFCCIYIYEYIVQFLKHTFDALVCIEKSIVPIRL